MDQPPVFICGIGRSGTSLLQMMLAQNSALAVAPETHFLRRYVVPSYKVWLWKLSNQRHRKKRLDSDPYLRRLGPDLVGSDVIKSYSRCKHPLEISADIMRRYCDKHGTGRYAEKDPRLAEWVLGVSKCIPGAKFVYIVRDPRAVCASKLKAAWSSHRGFIGNLFISYAQHLIMTYTLARSDMDKKVYVISYECLLADTEEELRKLANWLDMEFEEGMLNFSESAKRLVHDDEKAWKMETMGPLLKDNNNKWLTQLNAKQVATVELTMRDLFSRYEYRSSQSSEELSLLQQMLVKIVTLHVRTASRLYMLFRVFLGQ